MKEYKITKEPWDLVESKDSKDFVQLDYERTHPNYECPQKKTEIYMKSRKGLKLVCLWESGVLGGTFTSYFEERIKDFEPLTIEDGRGKTRKSINVGTKGNVEHIFIQDGKIRIYHRYQTGKWTKYRTWFIKVVE